MKSDSSVHDEAGVLAGIVVDAAIGFHPCLLCFSFFASLLHCFIAFAHIIA